MASTLTTPAKHLVCGSTGIPTMEFTNLEFERHGFLGDKNKWL